MGKAHGLKHELLIDLIQDTGLSQKEFAEKINMRATDLSKVINFSRKLKYTEAKAMAAFFNSEANTGRTLSTEDLLEYGPFNAQAVMVNAATDANTGVHMALGSKKRRLKGDQLNETLSTRITVTDDTLSALRVFTGDVAFIRDIDCVESGYVIALRFKNDEKIVLRKAQVINDDTLILFANPTVDPIIIATGDIDIVGRVVKVERFL